MTSAESESAVSATVWDLALRIFHWALVLLFFVAYVSGIRPGYFALHEASGYGILGLLVFRVIWGFVGPSPARFASFVRGPRAALAHLGELLRRKHQPVPGHNPLGGWAVMAILALLLVQTVSGLFASTFDYEGPLARLLPDTAQDAMAGIHAFAMNILLAVLAVHLLGIAATSYLGRENLVASMIHGRKELAARDGAQIPTRALVASSGRGGTLGLGSLAAPVIASIDRLTRRTRLRLSGRGKIVQTADRCRAQRRRERPLPNDDDAKAAWNQRYAGEGYLFGREPNRFLAAEADRLNPGLRVLCLADGEGRNGSFLAARGLDVLSVDISPVALAKARALAAERGVTLKLEEANLATWNWPVAAFDAVVAVFIQFAGPRLRSDIFRDIEACLKPGGLLLLEGYRPEQLAYGTGGPPDAANMYTEALLREGFAEMEILSLRSYDAAIEEGTAHKGLSALIDLVACKRISTV